MSTATLDIGSIVGVPDFENLSLEAKVAVLNSGNNLSTIKATEGIRATNIPSEVVDILVESTDWNSLFHLWQLNRENLVYPIERDKPTTVGVVDYFFNNRDTLSHDQAEFAIEQALLLDEPARVD